VTLSRFMREMSVAEQRYQAVLAVIKDGRTVKEVAAQWSVSCPHQMPAEMATQALELRRAHPY
jgi:hypothetical protein